MVPEAQPGHLPSPSVPGLCHSLFSLPFRTFQPPQGKGLRMWFRGSYHLLFPHMWKRR